MRLYIVREYMVVEYEECFRIMSVHSSEDKAKEAITTYEEAAKSWSNCHVEYGFEELELDENYYSNYEEEQEL